MIMKGVGGRKFMYKLNKVFLQSSYGNNTFIRMEKAMERGGLTTQNPLATPLPSEYPNKICWTENNQM